MTVPTKRPIDLWVVTHQCTCDPVQVNEYFATEAAALQSAAFLILEEIQITSERGAAATLDGARALAHVRDLIDAERFEEALDSYLYVYTETKYGLWVDVSRVHVCDAPYELPARPKPWTPPVVDDAADEI